MSKVRVYTADLAIVYEALGDDLLTEQCHEIESWICKMANLNREFDVKTIQALCNYSDNFSWHNDHDVKKIVAKWRKNNPGVLT